MCISLPFLVHFAAFLCAFRCLSLCISLPFLVHFAAFPVLSKRCTGLTGRWRRCSRRACRSRTCRCCRRTRTGGKADLRPESRWNALSFIKMNRDHDHDYDHDHDRRNGACRGRTDGRTPLIVAAMHGRLEAVAELACLPSAQLDLVDDVKNWTALHYAARREHLLEHLFEHSFEDLREWSHCPFLAPPPCQRLTPFPCGAAGGGWSRSPRCC